LAHLEQLPPYGTHLIPFRPEFRDLRLQTLDESGLKLHHGYRAVAG